MFLRVLWAGEWNMTRKTTITSAQETVVAAGKSAAKRAIALAGEVANAASIRRRVRKKLL
jgi:hypothetical protein